MLRHRFIAAGLAVALAFFPTHRGAAQEAAPPAATPAALPAAALAIESQFREGLAALEAGDTETAIRRFTSILASDPRLHRVRLELARAYFMAEDWADARREFFAVLSADVPQAVKDNIIVFLRMIDIRRGWSWNLDAGLRGGPEAGRRYGSDTVMLNILGQPLPFTVERPDTPDFGAFVNGGLEFRERLHEFQGGPTLSGIARVDGEANLYDDSDFNELTYGGGLAAQFAWPRTTLRVGPDATWRRFGGDARDWRWGGAASIEHRLPEGLALFSRLGWSKVDDAISDNRDGELWNLRFGVSRSLGGRSAITGIVSVIAFNAEAEHESYRAGRAELRGRTELVWGLAPTLTLAAMATRYRERAPLFFDRRRDRQLSAELEIEKRDLFIGPFSPFVAIGYTRNYSTIDIHEFDETTYRAGLRKIF